jgi:hypothetical protein
VLVASQDVLVLLPHLSTRQTLLVAAASLVNIRGRRGIGRVAVLEQSLQLFTRLADAAIDVFILSHLD